MKKVIAIAVALSALGTAQVFAQAKNFEGFNLGANLEIDHGSSHATDGSSGSAHKSGLGLEARYDWALNNQFLLGLGVSTGTGQRTAGAYTTGVTALTKDRYAFDLMPGYALGNDMVVYAKVSHLSAKAQADDGTTASVHGSGLGLGLRGLIDQHTYWQAGLDTQHYKDVTFASGTTASLKDNVLSLGVGYKF